ncbi:hypothetical protein C4K04_4341 [Pseudomonas chlororaphis]|uniref:Uncharacterized protein n=1 Tax=Pseudomonas chlororaphis TaxID=587753 RepID=A0A3G7TSB2_9PSED|nr:hypothetical protein [Pseudomonas chlororaphis]AZE50005.1 hypothetical protein C4K04_4341 [Pseudomonas chlororaphis]
MNFPSSLAGLETIRVHSRVGQRWHMTLSGVPGWCWEYPLGLCVALAIERTSIDDEWLVRTSLWLASIPESLDDSLLLDGANIFLVRRHDSQCPPRELEARVQQQLSIACWFATHDASHPGFTETRTVGRLA